MSISTKIDIRTLSFEQLQKEIHLFGEPPFKAKQIYEWLWKKSAFNFSEMTNISKSLREKLEERFEIRAVKILTQQKSKDGTIKLAFTLWDDNIIEGVLIPTTTRMTACVSSQVGCSLSCSFCATGYLERSRNLDAAEIYDQVVLISQLAIKNYNIPLSNIVYMGMGEPLLNYSNVMKSIEHITKPEGLGMSPQRITVSTAGISKMIKRLGDEEVKFNLALSLHAANDVRRSSIMPINDSNNLESLVDALNYFHDKTGTRVTLEYCVINDTNDHEAEALELAVFAKKVKCKINLIEYNPIQLADFKASSAQKIEKFASILEQQRLIVNIRRSRGKDIDAACGQLANKIE
jgi:23S rRNA (adenine2503-C2)-methyltransferase